jgi:thymidylate kinase
MKRLIEIAGIDGAGKTTLALSLQKELEKRGIRAEYASFLQGSDPFIDEVKKLSLALPTPEKERLLGELYSFRFVSRTLTGLENSSADFIFIDRYLSSHLISQQIFGVHLNHLDPLFQVLPKPSATLFLDLPVSSALQRLRLRGDLKPHETQEYLQKAREIYTETAMREPWIFLDALLPAEKLTKQALDAIYFC